MKTPAKLKMKHIDHDCCLIMEAIRRLEEGTWLLKDEDDDYSWYLFPKIRESLNEHVALEEQFLFPKLSSSECRRHSQHHHRFLLQLRHGPLRRAGNRQAKAGASTSLQAGFLQTKRRVSGPGLRAEADIQTRPKN